MGFPDAVVDAGTARKLVPLKRGAGAVFSPLPSLPVLKPSVAVKAKDDCSSNEETAVEGHAKASSHCADPDI